MRGAEGTPDQLSYLRNRDTRGVTRLSAEIIDHLWPWRRGSGGSGHAGDL